MPGLLAGGALADRWAMRRRDGRMLVTTITTAFSAPLMLFALMQPLNGAVFALDGILTEITNNAVHLLNPNRSISLTALKYLR